MFFCFFFFSIFEIARLGKIRQTHWKQRIEISKICQVLKLFVENERVRRYSSPKSPTDFTVVCMVGGGHKLVPPPHHTNVCKFLQLCGAISSLS